MHSVYVNVDVKPFVGKHQLDIALPASYSPAKASELPITREFQPIRTSQWIFGKGMGVRVVGGRRSMAAMLTSQDIYIYIYMRPSKNELIVLDRLHDASELIECCHSSTVQ